MVVVLILCIFCTIMYTAFSIHHFVIKKEFDGLFITTMMYDLVFGIFPLIISLQIVFTGSQYDYINSILDLSEEGINALIYYYFMAFTGFVAIWLSYFSEIRKYSSKIKRENYSMVANENKNSLMPIVAWSCLFVSAVSLFLWSKAYGTIFTLMKNANKVRSGPGLGGVTNNLAFFKHPTKIVLIATQMFFILIFKDKSGNGKIRAKRIANIIGFLISSILSGFYLVANDGRLTILIFLLSLLWLTTAGRKNQNVVKTILCGCCVLIISILLLYQMDNITHYLRFGVWKKSEIQGKLLYSVIKELGFLPRGGQTSVMSAWNGKVKLTFIDDLVTGLFAWVPTKFKPIGFEDVWNINTILIFGDLSVSHGQQPCSIITQGYYDLRYLGVIFFCIMLGRFVKKVDAWDLNEGTLFTLVVKANIMGMLFRVVPYFSFYDIILGFFPLIVVIVVYKTLIAIDYRNSRNSK